MPKAIPSGPDRKFGIKTPNSTPDRKFGKEPDKVSLASRLGRRIKEGATSINASQRRGKAGPDYPEPSRPVDAKSPPARRGKNPTIAAPGQKIGNVPQALAVTAGLPETTRTKQRGPGGPQSRGARPMVSGPLQNARQTKNLSAGVGQAVNGNKLPSGGGGAPKRVNRGNLSNFLSHRI